MASTPLFSRIYKASISRNDDHPHSGSEKLFEEAQQVEYYAGIGEQHWEVTCRSMCRLGQFLALVSAFTLCFIYSPFFASWLHNTSGWAQQGYDAFFGTSALPQPSEKSTPKTTARSYVAFGDSYAAGMGTGNTDWDGCRQGEYSYPKIVATALGINDTTNFQHLPCSGAVINDVLSGNPKSQLDTWSNASQTDLATVTVSGNDLGFYNVLTACVVRVGGVFAGDCMAEVAKANKTLHNETFAADLQQVMHGIVNKSSHPDFRLFFVGYPLFFNASQDDCNQVTFGIWNPHHNWGPQSDFSAAWLYKDLRMILNDLVDNLNQIIRQNIKIVNNDYTSPHPRVAFIDPNESYDFHRFCESNTTEPDSGRADTWFFLNGWDDVIPEMIASEAGHSAYEGEQIGLLNKNFTRLPDPATCREQLHSTGQHDWTEKALCDMAIAYTDKSSDAHRIINEHANGVGDDKNASALEIPWYIPSRAAKMFHPRSAGHLAIAQLILDAL